MRPPGEFEHTVLLAVAGAGGETTGRAVYEAIVEATGRDASVASVHITLQRLNEKGWVARRTTDPPPGVGGKPRRRYELTREGAEVLTRQRTRLDRLWDRAAAHPLLGRGET